MADDKHKNQLRWSRFDGASKATRLAVAAFVVGFAIVGYKVLQPSQAADLGVTLQSYATGLTLPTDISFTKVGGDNRMFVVEKAGKIKIINNGAVAATPFLDISSKVNSTANERGMLGLAFHPDYATNGYFYVTYNKTSGDVQLSRFTRSNTSPDTADPASEKPILTVTHTANNNHNGGGLHFGPDGFLYYSTGDGGGAGDQPNNAQNLESLQGKILRLDINSGDPYVAPPSNPFVGKDGADEIWAYGLRNPWRFSFDKQTGDMLIGDVGQDNIEEIDFQPAGAGGRNYGWRCYEGSAEYNTAGCQPASAYIKPIAEYDHSDQRCSVTGGYRYRGIKYPAIQGNYFYADYCGGQLYSMSPNADGSIWTSQEQGQIAAKITSFGEDAAGELYTADATSGTIYKLVAPDPADTEPPTVTVTAPANGANVTGSLNITVNAADNVGVAKVDYLVDGTLVGTSSVSPFSFAWDTATTPNGQHSLTVKAYDAAQNFGSQILTLTVQNGGTSSTPADLNRDGKVNLTDLSILLSHWNSTASPLQGDLNNDGKVTLTDLSVLLSAWTG